MLISSPSLSSSGYLSSLSNDVTVNILTVSSFFFNSIYVCVNFHFQRYVMYGFFSIVSSFFFANSPFRLSISVKMSLGFITRR